MTPHDPDRPNALRALATLHEVLQEIGWDSPPADADGVVAIRLGPPLPVSDALAAIALRSERFIFYLNLARHAPWETREQVARLIGRINWELSIGDFEMDAADGHVRFRSSVDFLGLPLDAQLIRNHILAGMRAVETYGAALLDAIDGRADAGGGFANARGRGP